MFIIHGTKRKEKKLGYVADFCPLCHEVRAFELYRIGLAGHVYYISLTEGKLAGHLVRCTVCKAPYSSDPKRYLAVEPRAPRELESLEQQTFPNLRLFYASRLAVEERLRRTPSSLSIEERAYYMLEMFRVANGEVDLRYTRETELDRPAGIGCLGTLILPFVAWFVARRFPEMTEDNMAGLIGAIVVAGGLYTLIQIALAPRRYMRRRIAPQVARALEPFHPSFEEVQACLLRCRSQGWKIGAKLKPAEVWAELERLGVS